MTHRIRRTRMLKPKPRRLNLECLEARLCLSTYTTVDLIPLPGHDHAKAFGLNDNGLAVGRSHLLGDSSQDAAVVWSVDPAGDVSASALPGVGGEQSVHAVEVNNHGIIVGESKVPQVEGGYTHAVVWTGAPGSYAVHDLGTLGETADGNFLYSSARSVSEADANGDFWVVGTSANVSADPQIHRGVLWQVDVAGNVLSMTDLEPTSNNVGANDVKVVGGSVFVVGDFVPESPHVQACIWETDLSGHVVGRNDLGTAEFEAFQGNALNSHRDVAGTGYNSALQRNGFLYENSDGSITDLGSLGNEGSNAWGINDSDVVVGSYLNVKPQGFYTVEEHAFVWENGTMYDLLDQVSDRAFWLLFSANDVNDNGEIVGNGRAGKRNDSQEHGFLARPEDAAGQHPPVAVDDAASTVVGTAVTIHVLANDYDPDGDVLSIDSFTQGTEGTVADGGNRTLTYTPTSVEPGFDSFTYAISDSNGGTDTATVTIDVTPASSETALYVYDIRFESNRGERDWRAVFEIRSDSNADGQGSAADDVAAGVAITVEFGGRTYTGTTDADGVFRSDWFRNLRSGDHYAEVVDLVLANYFWDPLATTNLEDDSDGDGKPDDVLFL